MDLDPRKRHTCIQILLSMLPVINCESQGRFKPLLWVLASQKRNGNVRDMQKALNTNSLSEWTQQETKCNNLSVSPDISIQAFIYSFHTLYSQMQVNRNLAGVMIPLDLKESIHYVKLKKINKTAPFHKMEFK